MTNHNLVDRMNTCFNQLEQAIESLVNQLKQLELLHAQVFSLPEIEKGSEHNPANSIEVIPSHGETAHLLALQHFQRLFIYHNAHNISSKSAVRLPGVLCYAVDLDEYKSTRYSIDTVNQLKGELERIVTIDSGLEREQRFEFVHSHLRGLITLNAYRSIGYLIDPDSVRFGWANKHIIKNVSRHDILAQLEKSLNAGRSVPPYSREQWAENITREINDVKRLPEQAILKIKRPVKVQPIARVWYSDAQKQVQHPCPLPLIAFCLRSPTMHMPKFGELGNYDINTIKHKYKPNAQPLNLLIKRLHLYTDHSI